MYCNEPDPIREDTEFGLSAEVHYDPFPDSPRDTCDTLTHICADLDRYALGDELLSSRNTEDLIGFARSLFEDGALIVGFADAWDSPGGAEIAIPTWLAYRPTMAEHGDMISSANKVLIYVTRESAAACFGDNVPTTRLIEAADAELSTYRAYLRGDVYYYAVRDTATDDLLETVCGYYDDAEYAHEDAKHSRASFLRARLHQTLNAMGGGLLTPDLA